jgi:hypothetical protein
VDDLLLSGFTEKEVTDATVNLLNFTLGYLIRKGKCRLSPERIEGIISMPLPLTKKECQKFLGLIGHCRLWIESYVLKTKTLYSKLLEKEPDP